LKLSKERRKRGGVRFKKGKSNRRIFPDHRSQGNAGGGGTCSGKENACNQGREGGGCPGPEESKTKKGFESGCHDERIRREEGNVSPPARSEHLNIKKGGRRNTWKRKVSGRRKKENAEERPLTGMSETRKKKVFSVCCNKKGGN